MDNIKEKFGGGKPTYQQEQAKLRSEEREKEDKKLRRKKRIKDRRARERQKFNETLAKLPVKVKEVHLEGITGTKDILVKNILSDILKANTYGEVLSHLRTAHSRLKKLGCFKRVDGLIDNVDNSSELAITFRVQERDPLYGNVGCETSDNEANLHLFAGLKNVLGHGESLESSYLRGTRGTRKMELRYNMPLIHYLQNTATNRAAFFVATIFNHRYNHSWSSLRLDDMGFKIGGVFEPFSWLKQSVQWRASWRQLQPLPSSDPISFKNTNAILADNTQLPFDAREACGHTLKSSLIHKLSYDTRDDRVLPTNGVHATLVQELAGLSPIGTTAFFKTMCSFDVSKRLTEYLSVSFSAASGLVSPMKALDGRDVSLIPQDRFLLGGPLILRGFSNKAIQHSQTSTLDTTSERIGRKFMDCYLGGTAFWRTCAQLYFPMPYLRRKNTWIADNMKGHIFVESGSLGNPVNRKMLKAFGEEWTSLHNIRASCGLGLVLRLGDYGRAELNYCVPLRCKNGDRVQHGLQFGIGVDFS